MRKKKPLDKPIWPGEGITAANYVERAAAFVGANGEGFVIRSVEGMNGERATRQPATDAQWIAWTNYWTAKGIKHAFAVKHGVATVPSEWPELFDIYAEISQRDRCLSRISPRAYRAAAKIDFGRIAKAIPQTARSTTWTAPIEPAVTDNPPDISDELRELLAREL